MSDGTMRARGLTPDEARERAVHRDEWLRAVTFDPLMTRQAVLKTAVAYWTHAGSRREGLHGPARPVWAGQKALADRIGFNESTVSGAQAELVKRGYLTAADYEAFVAEWEDLAKADSRTSVYVLTRPAGGAAVAQSKPRRDTTKAPHARWHLSGLAPPSTGCKWCVVEGLIDASDA